MASGQLLVLEDHRELQRVAVAVQHTEYEPLFARVHDGHRVVELQQVNTVDDRQEAKGSQIQIELLAAAALQPWVNDQLPDQGASWHGEAIDLLVDLPLLQPIHDEIGGSWGPAMVSIK